MLATLFKRSKHTYFSSFFQNHINDLKKTWKSIKRIVSLKNSTSTVPFTIIEDNISLTKLNSSVKYSRNKFFDFLPQININFFFINPTDKTEIKNIILSFDPLKSIGPNSIPIKILKLLSNDISTRFTELFNLSFSEGVFSSICKICKVIQFIKRIHNLMFQLLANIPIVKH